MLWNSIQSLSEMELEHLFLALPIGCGLKQKTSSTQPPNTETQHGLKEITF